jgi:translocator protein
MIEWTLLWLSVLSLIVGTWRLSRPAALLNIPYLAWVTVAGGLNLATIRLNGPFI